MHKGIPEVEDYLKGILGPIPDRISAGFLKQISGENHDGVYERIPGNLCRILKKILGISKEILNNIPKGILEETSARIPSGMPGQMAQ